MSQISLVEDSDYMSDERSDNDKFELKPQSQLLELVNCETLTQIEAMNLNKRILVIDDEPFNIVSLLVLINSFKIKGLTRLIDRAYNGQEGFNKAKSALVNRNHIYGLIITDISMPVMDGYEVSKEIRHLYESNGITQPKIVACTGHVEEDYIKRAWSHNIDEILPKPINKDILYEIIYGSLDVKEWGSARSKQIVWLSAIATVATRATCKTNMCLLLY